MLFDDAVLLSSKTEKLFEESEKVFDWYLKQEEITTLDWISNLSGKDLKLLQKGLKLYSRMKDLEIAQAKEIDKLSNKVDTLMTANARLSDKMDEMMKKLERIDERGKMVLVKKDEE